VYKRADDKKLYTHRKYIMEEFNKPYTKEHLSITTENDVIHISRKDADIFDTLIDLINNVSPILVAELNDESTDGGSTTFSINSTIIYDLLYKAHDIVYTLVMYAIAKIKDNIDIITNYKTNLSHLFYRGSLYINRHDIDYLEPIIETKMDEPDLSCDLICRQWWILQKLEKIIDDAVGDGDRHEWIHGYLDCSSKLIKQLPQHKRPVSQRFFDDIIDGEKFDDMVERWKTKGGCITGKVFDKIRDEETKAFIASRKTCFDDNKQKEAKKQEIAVLRKRIQELEKEISET